MYSSSGGMATFTLSQKRHLQEEGQTHALCIQLGSRNSGSFEVPYSGISSISLLAYLNMKPHLIHVTVAIFLGNYDPQRRILYIKYTMSPAVFVSILCPIVYHDWYI